MRAFFGFYLTLLIGVFGLWAIQPLRAEQEEFARTVAREVLTQINAVRAEAKLPSLLEDGTLSSVAHAHSFDMLSKKYFSHQDSRQCNSSCRLSEVEYRAGASGENIYMTYEPADTAKDIARAVVEQWAKNPAQRKNILHHSFTHTGIGVALRPGALYATEEFADAK